MQKHSVPLPLVSCADSVGVQAEGDYWLQSSETGESGPAAYDGDVSGLEEGAEEDRSNAEDNIHILPDVTISVT